MASTFKKMVLVDYDSEFPKSKTLNQEKVFNIRSRILNPSTDAIKLIDEGLLTIEHQMNKLIKNRKIKSEDKLMYLAGLLKRHADLSILKRSEIEQDDVNLIKKIRKIIPETLNDVGHASDIPAGPSRIASEEEGEEEEAIIPRNLFRTDSDDSDGADVESYETARDGFTGDVIKTPKHAPTTKRTYNTPFPSVGKKKFKTVAKKVKMIRSWDLRPTVVRLAKREALHQKLQKIPKKKN